MKEFIRIMNKYVILLIVSSLFGIPWFYLSHIFFKNYQPDSFVNYVPSIANYLIRLIVIVLIIIDFRKNNLKNILLTCIATLFYPLLGIVIFAILFIDNERNKANA